MGNRPDRFRPLPYPFPPSSVDVGMAKGSDGPESVGWRILYAKPVPERNQRRSSPIARNRGGGTAWRPTLLGIVKACHYNSWQLESCLSRALRLIIWGMKHEARHHQDW